MLGPLPCLIIGVAVILVFILYLRLHAFFALIASALLVAFLSDRVPVDGVLPLVTGRFGQLMGSIGILLAMAAIIGKCLTDSGAADRIVRFFSRIFGAGREQYSILASGFVLSIPVFFDTVFYLLAPLTRAVYARRKRDYVMIICFAAAGGVLTHALVPPTPGPIIVSEELGVSILTTIAVGLLASIVPLLVAGVGYIYFINSMLDLKPGKVMGMDEEDIEAIAQKRDDELPGLMMSFMPIVFPVVLLAVSTTVLQWTGTGLLRVSDINDMRTFMTRIQSDDTPISTYLASRLPVEPRTSTTYPSNDPAEFQVEAKKFIEAIDKVITSESIYNEERFQGITLSPTALSMLKTKIYPNQTVRLNRVLLEDAFPDDLKKCPVGWIKWLELMGDKNLVFIGGAIIGIWLLIRQSNKRFQDAIESLAPALGSGAIIALITCAGGSFGKALETAGIGDMVAGYAQNWGVPLLVLAYLTATLVRVAQGSATVAMITTVSIIAPSLATVNLGYHPVYFVAVIGFGATGFSWMNDSGFWIFSQMTGLSEANTLKTWTVLLSVLSISGFAWVWLLTKMLPLV